MDKNSDKEVMIVEAWATTTERDIFGGKLELSDLEKILEKMKESPWMAHKHDPTINSGAKIINQEIKKMENGEYGILVKYKVFRKDLVDDLRSGKTRGMSVTTIQPFDNSKLLNIRLDDRAFDDRDLEFIKSNFSQIDKINVGYVSPRAAEVIPNIICCLTLEVLLEKMITVAAIGISAEIGRQLGKEIGKDLADIYRQFIDSIKSKLSEKNNKKFFFAIILKGKDFQLDISSKNNIPEDFESLDRISLELNSIFNKTGIPINIKDVLKVKVSIDDQNKISSVSVYLRNKKLFNLNNDIWEEVK